MSDPESAKSIQVWEEVKTLTEKWNAESEKAERRFHLTSVEAWGKRSDASAITALIKILNHKDEEVCSAATEALVKIGAPAVRPLGKMLKSENGSVCRCIAATLVKSGIPGVPFLVEALRHDEALHYAINALREIGEAESLPYRVLCCRELSPQLRIDTLKAMRQRGRKRRELRAWNTLPDVQLFCAQVREEDDEAAREEARVVLNWLEGGNQLLRASQRDTRAEAQELLRGATAMDSATAPDELLRAGDSTDTEAILPAAKEPKRRGLLARFRRTDV
jgi:hypothetical protein